MFHLTKPFERLIYPPRKQAALGMSEFAIRETYSKRFRMIAHISMTLI
jgi:hypothetical protein